MNAEALLALFDTCAAAQRGALASLDRAVRRDRTERAGQYRLDLIADDAILPLLHAAGLRVLSEESGWTGPDDSDVTVVLDPVDGSTNCARGIPYWALSACALDADGLWCAVVANGATGRRYAAVRGEGATCDELAISAAPTTRVEDAVVACSGLPAADLPAKQYRVLGSTALSLCDVAAGGLDAVIDFVDEQRPWDYLGGLLIAREAGATVLDQRGRELVVADAEATRQLLATATTDLADEMTAALR